MFGFINLIFLNTYNLTTKQDQKMKQIIRAIGIDDFPFNKFKDKKTRIVGVVYRADRHIDGIVSKEIKVDGNDSTEKIIDMINSSKYRTIIKVIFLKGIALGGFNIINIKELFEKTKIPIIIVMRHKPTIEKNKSNLKIKQTLIKLNKSDKIKLIDLAGEVYKVNKRLFIQLYGINLFEAEQYLKLFSYQSVIPEPIRIAHLIGAGIKLGESHGDV